MSLSTPLCSVEKLQSSLQAKAKSEPSYRFYNLWDKIYGTRFSESINPFPRRNENTFEELCVAVGICTVTLQVTGADMNTQEKGLPRHVEVFCSV